MSSLSESFLRLRWTEMAFPKTEAPLDYYVDYRGRSGEELISCPGVIEKWRAELEASTNTAEDESKALEESMLLGILRHEERRVEDLMRAMGPEEGEEVK